jgi:hypothetical protein
MNGRVGCYGSHRFGKNPVKVNMLNLGKPAATFVSLLRATRIGG